MCAPCQFRPQRLQLIAGRVVAEALRGLVRLQDGHVVALHPRQVAVVLHQRPSRLQPLQVGQVLPHRRGGIGNAQQ